MFSGSMTALVTPFRDGEFDEPAYRGLIEFQIGAGTDALVPCGTTGESATLSHAEHDRVVETCIAAAAGRVPVIAGAGSNSTSEALRLTRHAKEAGADAALLITPYYNKPTQEGLYRHFAHVAERVDLPIVLYNVPGRTGVNLLPETVARLAEIGNIVAIKEATGDLRQASRIIELCGDRIAVISGDDFTVLPLLAIGGTGAISVVSNVAPQLAAQLVDAFVAGDLRTAREAHYRLLPLSEAMFIETNPIPVKTALGLMGKIEPEFRLPMCPMAEKHRERLAAVLRTAGLIAD
jgi:4-hydroxy-tetrahydrodipicolinate synthase